jgi:hypothetical protein
VLSKYNNLSYAVGTKDQKEVPEETYYSKIANKDEVIEIMYGKPVHNEQRGVTVESEANIIGTERSE